MSSPYNGFLWRQNEESVFWSFHPLTDKTNNEHLTKPFFKVVRNRSNKLSNVRTFIILRSGEGLASTNEDKSVNFSGGRKGQLSRIPECVRSEWKALNQISTRTRSLLRVYWAIKHLFIAVQSAAWENSRHFVTPWLVFVPCEMTFEKRAQKFHTVDIDSLLWLKGYTLCWRFHH